MDWTSVIEIAAGVFLGALTGAYFAWRSARELRRESEKLRQLTLKLTHILAASGQIEVSTWDPETGEPSSWPVGIKADILHDVDAHPRWRRVVRRIIGR